MLNLICIYIKKVKCVTQIKKLKQNNTAKRIMFCNTHKFSINDYKTLNYLLFNISVLRVLLSSLYDVVINF